MDKSKNLIIIIILLVIIIGGVSFYAFRQNQENKEMTELFAIEKEEMENEYTTFATQYGELQVQINNDSLRIKLESEKLKTQRLLEELRQVKSSNAAEITRLKKELKTYFMSPVGYIFVGAIIFISSIFFSTFRSSYLSIFTILCS